MSRRKNHPGPNLTLIPFKQLSPRSEPPLPRDSLPSPRTSARAVLFASIHHSLMALHALDPPMLNAVAIALNNLVDDALRERARDDERQPSRSKTGD